MIGDNTVEIPKDYNPLEVEPKWQRRWGELGVYRFRGENNQERGSQNIFFFGLFIAAIVCAFLFITEFIALVRGEPFDEGKLIIGAIPIAILIVVAYSKRPVLKLRKTL